MTYACGTVVLVRFPFSDLSASKRRPAVVLADAGRGDVVLAQVTSKPYADPGAVELTGASFARGGLNLTSYARPGKLFTANDTLIVRDVGALTAAALDEVLDAVIKVLGR
ncbi:MAG: type II toxin-antitoxin system PemK/MazF family toxin [Bacteroidota bacterium]